MESQDKAEVDRIKGHIQASIKTLKDLHYDGVLFSDFYGVSCMLILLIPLVSASTHVADSYGENPTKRSYVQLTPFMAWLRAKIGVKSVCMLENIQRKRMPPHRTGTN